MLTDLIIGAFTFKSEVYAKVEKDKSFTNTAWLIVVVAAFISQLGANASLNPISWLLGAVGGTIFAVLGFALAAFVISWAGKALFKADVTFEEMVRTLGLAYVWNIVGFLGVFGLLGPLVCLVTPIAIIAGILGLIASLIAAKEALDLEWVQTIVTVVIGWIAMWVIVAIGGAILGVLGWGARAAANAIR